MADIRLVLPMPLILDMIRIETIVRTLAPQPLVAWDPPPTTLAQLVA
jgi:hypothetical protein